MLIIPVIERNNRTTKSLNEPKPNSLPACLPACSPVGADVVKKILDDGLSSCRPYTSDPEQPSSSPHETPAEQTLQGH